MARAASSFATTPPRTSVWMNYRQTIPIATTLASGFAAYYLESNHLFQMDPSVSSTTPGFSSYAGRYATYRVRAYKGSVSFENSSFGSTLGVSSGSSYVCHSNTNLGVSSGGSHTSLEAFSCLAKNSIRPLAAVGGPPSVHVFNRSIRSIVGENVMKDSYKSLVNGAPSSLTYLVFGFKMPSTTFTGNLPSCTATITMMVLVDFLDYIDTLTSFEQIQKCAACAALSEKSYVPCRCGTRGECRLCHWECPCSEDHRLHSCPLVRVKAELRPPLQRRKSL